MDNKNSTKNLHLKVINLMDVAKRELPKLGLRFGSKTLSHVLEGNKEAFEASLLANNYEHSLKEVDVDSLFSELQRAAQ